MQKMELSNNIVSTTIMDRDGQDNKLNSLISMITAALMDGLLEIWLLLHTMLPNSSTNYLGPQTYCLEKLKR